MNGTWKFELISKFLDNKKFNWKIKVSQFESWGFWKVNVKNTDNNARVNEVTHIWEIKASGNFIMFPWNEKLRLSKKVKLMLSFIFQTTFVKKPPKFFWIQPALFISFCQLFVEGPISTNLFDEQCLPISVMVG